MKIRYVSYKWWYYLRTGYSLYVAFPLGFVSTVIVVYSLGIKPTIESNPPTAIGDFLQLIFPRLTYFLITGAVVLIPVCILLGMYHTRKTGPYEADASLLTEQNPYAFKAIPGKELEVFIPLWLMTAQALEKILDQQKIMTAEERRGFEEAINKATTLVKGKMVGLDKSGKK